MLFDPKWQKSEVKADPFSLDSLIAWLEKQPAAVEYDYFDHRRGCLLAQYAKAHGLTFCAVNQPTEWNFLVAVETPHTFGAALKRARALQQSRPTSETTKAQL